VQSPKREVGATSLAKLAEMAQQAHLPMARAAMSHGALKALPARAAGGLSAFNDTVHDLREHAPKLQAGELLRRLAEKSGLLAELRAQCKDEASFERRKANLEELAEWFEGGRGSAGDLAAQLALLSRNDKDDGGNQVRLMSLHAAKGLEFRYVFIVGCEDGTLPHETAMEEGSLAEERRLMYVGITRAKQGLYLSHSRTTRRFRETVRLQPSRFLDELPQAELQRDGADPVADAERRQERAKVGFAAISALFDE
jgi:ATP-dependent DNA helicase Rep